MIKSEIHGLTFISSAICNLNCSFCYLYKNKAYTEFNKLTREAWKNKTYIPNVCKSLDILNVNKEKIKSISLWGGETLLTIDDITENIPLIYNNFPNIEEWLISTNWTIDVNKVFNFFKEIDNFSNKFTKITLQFSIDGPPGPISESGHNGWFAYEKNIDLFTNLINNYKFKHMHINIHINAVLPKDLYLTTFSSYEGMYNYMKFMLDFKDSIKSKCISESLDFRDGLVLPGYASPYEDSQEDGRKLAEIFRLWDIVYEKEFKNKYEYRGFYLGIGHFSKNKSFFSKNVECQELRHALTFNYDGSICECNGSFIDNYKPYLQELKEMKNDKEYEIANSHNKMTSYNPQFASFEQQENYSWAVHDGGYRNNSLTYLHMAFNLAKALLHAKQISSIYEDDDLLYKHLLVVLNATSCSRNNIIETHIPYLTPIGALRRYLNGAAEYIYESEIKYFKEVQNAKYSI